MVGPLALTTLNQMNAGGCMGDGTGLLIAFALVGTIVVAVIAVPVLLLRWAWKTAHPGKPAPAIVDDARVLRGPND